MRIKVLEAQLANQIAAGEVVERPSSVIKELVENSIDAQATKIAVDLEQGGLQLIRVKDNGSGIHPQDLALAISRHATSKIKQSSDLEKINSLGFRGEALASIAAISRLKLASGHEGYESGFCLVTEGGEWLAKPAPFAHPIGTTIEIRDLFFNTPARRKFMRAPRTEFNHAEVLLQKLALSHFDVGFSLKHNQRSVFDFRPATQIAQIKERVTVVMGEAFIENAIELEFESSGLKLTGFIGHPNHSRSQADMQFFYVNRRLVRDKVITHALREAYHDVLFHGRHPVYVLYLTIDPSLVDVNVHPTKHEVRFRQGRLVHDFLLRGVKDALEQISPQRNIPESITLQTESMTQAPDKTENEVPKTPQQIFSSHATNANLMLQEEPAIYTTTVLETTKTIEYPLGFALAQLQEIYILAQNKNGLIIVDMHAAHERIIYEKLKKEIEQQGIATQPLLLPIAIDLTKNEMHCWEEQQERFKNLGIVSEATGPQNILIREIPVLLKSVNIIQLIHDLLADLISYEKTHRVEDITNHLMASLSCRSAARAHHHLTIPQMNALLREMENTQNSSFCSHGRPSWIQLPLAEIDKLFLRGR